MELLEKAWHVYIGDTWLGTLTPTQQEGEWVAAAFETSENWENFSPWFTTAYDAHQAGDTDEWERIYGQLLSMGLVIMADDGAVYEAPTLLVEGSSAWIAV